MKNHDSCLTFSFTLNKIRMENADYWVYHVKFVHWYLTGWNYQFKYVTKKIINMEYRWATRAFSFNSADIPSASGCLICPLFIRTAQLVQQPATKGFKEANVIRKQEIASQIQQISIKMAIETAERTSVKIHCNHLQRQTSPDLNNYHIFFAPNKRKTKNHTGLKSIKPMKKGIYHQQWPLIPLVII